MLLAAGAGAVVAEWLNRTMFKASSFVYSVVMYMRTSKTCLHDRSVVVAVAGEVNPVENEEDDGPPPSKPRALTLPRVRSLAEAEAGAK